MELSKIKFMLNAKARNKNAYVARCPGHDDKHESLTFTEVNGKILVKCFANCDQKKLFQLIKQQYEGMYGKEEKKKPEPKAVTDKKEIRRVEYFYDRADQPRNRDRRFITDYEIAIWAVKKG